MKISVAICTYNGAKYIEEQLRSILNQSVPVDEICVGDDCSSDDTIKIIERIKKETGKDITIVINNPNLGCNANFDNTIKRCTGDIIFLSDQDDIWLPYKVKTIVDFFNDNLNKDVVFTNGYLMDENSQRFTEKKLFDVVGLGRDAIRQFCCSGLALEVLMVHNRATGATMALRRSFIGEYNIGKDKAYRSGDVFHDHIIALAAVAKDKLGVIVQPLIRYRVHSGQCLGFNKWIKNPPTTDDIYTVSHSLKFVKYVPDALKERAAMVTDRYYYKKSTLYNNFFVYFYRYIHIYGILLGIKVWWHDILNSIKGKGNFDWK